MSRTNIGLCVGLLLIVCAAPLLAQQPAVAGSASSAAVVPPLVSFNGVLTDLNGKPISGVTGVTFALYKDEQAGAPLWLETQNVYPDKTGHYTVLLGSTSSTGLPSDLFVAGKARWLGVQVQGQAEQARISLASAPYALKAADAQTVGGLPASAFVLAAPPASGGSSATSAAAAAQPLVTGTTPVTTAGGNVSYLAKFDAAADITSSQIFDNGTNVGIGTSTPSAKLDVKGSSAVRGLLSLPAKGTATATTAYSSQPFRLTSSSFNSGTATAVAENFQWQAEATGNNTASPSGTLNLLFASGTATPVETGLKIASNGWITFAPGQTFPGTGSGSVKRVATGLGLTGGPITTTGTVAIDPTVVPQLNVANVFTGNQTVNGNLSATGLVTGSSYQVGSNLFAWGSYSTYDAFLGFAGSSANTGQYNTASGVQALLNNTTGYWNTADGSGALILNTTGNYDTATGSWALAANTTGSTNTANGSGTLNANTTGAANTAIGAWALGKNTTGGNNTAAGSGALGSNTTASYNTADGAGALQSNTADQNTATGFQALYANTAATGNTADGAYALAANTTGNAVTAVGLSALNSNTTGGWNTAGGAFALQSNTTGSNNTAFGEEALSYNTTGSSNTALGFKAGPDQASTNLSNATAIGSNAVVSQSNALVLGCVNGVNSCPGAVNVGIGTAKPQYTLDVQGTGNFTGMVKFASGQTFPGTGTITGVTAGTDLTGGGTTGNVTLNLDTTKVVTGVMAGTDLVGSSAGGIVTLSLDTTKVPQLASANTFTGAQTVNNSVTITGTGGAAALFVSGPANGIDSTATGTSAGTAGVRGLNASSSGYGVYGGDDSGTGVFGIANQSSAYGVQGIDYNGTGVFGNGHYGIYGVGSNTSSYGVYGASTHSTSYGVYGVGSGTTSYGVYGNGTSYGVYGESDTATGYGVFGANNTSLGGVGVHGESSSGNAVEGISSAGTAGYFQGNVTITGTLSKAHGSFKIDHPLDPANKYLYHSFVESPDMMNIYNGNVVLDGEGAAWITLPDYFEALNRDFRYQLTAVGAPGPNLYIAQEIANNRFQIAGGTPGAKVSWQVTGIRQDAYAKAHPIVPEVEKTGDEKGKYLHPVEHGQPESMGIYQSRRPGTSVQYQHVEPTGSPN
jgi:hypothetical protein